MRKKLSLCLCLLLSFVFLSMTACTETENQTPTSPTTYTIQYNDDNGRHSAQVQSGKLFTLETLPARYGYDFLGLYDAQTGGTQYVDGSGYSLVPFSENRDLVLYPQFQAKEYTLILDYQGAAVTGVRYLNVKYGDEIENLPLNVKAENKDFLGWYTEPERKGHQIADVYGVVPENRKFTEKLFDLSDADRNVKLYAGFKNEEYTVTFTFGNGVSAETVKVEYGTPISEVRPQTRVNGKAVLSWSKRANDGEGKDVFDGKVTGDMTLYAAEYAPVIEFDANGGKAVPALIARAGEAIALPKPEKEHYKFIGWQDASGKSYRLTVMPEESVKLTAQWQAVIVFDSNGGTEVANISEPQGTEITLPETEREGYLFAGWYLGDERYEKTEMPIESIQLKACYYAIKLDRTIIASSSTTLGASSVTSTEGYYLKHTPSMSHFCYEFDVGKYYDLGIKSVNINVHYLTKVDNAPFLYTHMYWYSQREVSSVYQLWDYKEWHLTTEWEEYTQKTTLPIVSSKYYICLAVTRPGGGALSGFWKDFYIEIEYPDMSTLY